MSATTSESSQRKTIFIDVGNLTPNGTCLRCGGKDVPTLDVTSPCGRMHGFPLCGPCLFAAAEALDSPATAATRNGAKSQAKGRGKTSSRQALVAAQSANAEAGEADIPVAGVAAIPG